VSFEVRDEDGLVTYPPEPPSHRLHHLHTGRACGGAAGAGQPDPLASGDWWAATPAEIAAAAGDYFAYCGTYELGDGEVVHRVDMSLLPNWMGGNQVRRVAFDGERMTLSTPPTPIGGRQQIATLVWERT
jgi:Lipocalin-like domain